MLFWMRVHFKGGVEFSKILRGLLIKRGSDRFIIFWRGLGKKGWGQQFREGWYPKGRYVNRYLTNARVLFNDSWFIFLNSSLSFHKPYFSWKHIFNKLYRVNRTQDYGLKTCNTGTKLFNSVIILKAFLSTIFTITHFFIKPKFC